MMRLLADMGVDMRVVQWLRQNGHDAKHLREEGLHRIPNATVLSDAADALEKGAVIVVEESRHRVGHLPPRRIERSL